MSRVSRGKIQLGQGAEFDMIRKLIDPNMRLPPEVHVGPGDDAAVLEGGWVVSTDLAVEDVHFRRAWLSDLEIGYRAGAGALSDLAAMAATPVGVLVSMACPRDGDVDIEAVQGGLNEVCKTVGAAVIGGDISSSPGPLFIDLVALGCTSRPILRDGAKLGDEVWVTGALGASSAAVSMWREGVEPSKELRSAFARPAPRVEAAQSLVDNEIVGAMIDLSDGLAGDAGHIAAASGVKITLETGRIPVAAAAAAVLGADRALEAALHGGEDFELCFVADPGLVDTSYFQRHHGLQITRVGRVDEGEGVWLDNNDGSIRRLKRGGFDHWGTPSA